ncbi:MAG: polysaccharide biosynthesis C-terminal domain-containing protein [Romboutsia sp.]
MKRKKLILNALILTFATMSLGFISTGFRVYLSNKIGAEGMGLYQIVMSINFMASTFAISGIRVTTTRLVAEELGKGNTHNIAGIVRKGLLYSLLFSTITAIILYNYSEFIGTSLIKDTRSILPLKILSCGLPFTAFCSCISGYFYGARRVIKTITADILETFVMMSIIAIPLSAFLPKGLELTCCLISVAMSCGNIVAAIYSYLLYIFERKPISKKIGATKSKFSFFNIAYIAIPVACSAYIQTGLKTVEDILIPNALRQFGSSNSTSLAIFGMIKGMVLPILSFPSIFLASFSTLIIPEIAEANALHKNKLVIYIISKVFKFTLIIAMFASGLFIIFSNELGMALYNDPQVGVLMRILSPLIPLMYLDRVVDGSLNALNQQMSTLKYNLMDMSVRLTIILFLIPQKGIEGFIIVLFASTILNSTLSINKLLKVTNLNFQLIDWFLKPGISIALSCLIVKYTFRLLNLSLLIPIQIVGVIILYLAFLVIFKCITKKDIMWFVDGFRHEVKTIEWDNISIYKNL